jgi:L-lactate dehydrogenase (cytochrome)
MGEPSDVPVSTVRSVPRWRELRPLLRPKRLILDGTQRRLARAVSIPDLAAVALHRAPRAVFDYVHGAAATETALRRARAAFARTEIVPTVLQDVSHVDPSTTVLGRPTPVPIVFAPTGFTRMLHTAGESAVARVAARTGIPYALSTMGTTSIERLAQGAPSARRWFQLYLWVDREASDDLVKRALAADYEALVLTVDTPVVGPRLRDVRNGLLIPPQLTLKTFVDGALHPAWWFDLFTTEPLTFANFTSDRGAEPGQFGNRMFDPAATLDDVRRLREIWPRSLVVKGVATVADARAVVDAGADAIVVSNHGGRQLDRAPTPLEVLPQIVAEIGDQAEIYVDGGVLSGADVVAAVGLGARAVLVGRAYLYGLMAGGERGVQHAADLLTAEVRQTMQLAGIRSITELAGGGRVRLRP